MFYHNYLFFVVEIFSDGTHYQKFRYTNIIPVRRIFSIAILLFRRWLIVVPFFDHGNSVPDMQLVGSSECVKALQQLLPICLCTHGRHAQSKVPLFQLSWWKGAVIPPARIQSSHFLNLDKRALCLPPTCVLEFLKLEIFLDGYAHPKFIPYEYVHMRIK